MRRIILFLFISLCLCFSYISCTQGLEELTKTIYITTVWKGSFLSAPENPEAGWAYLLIYNKSSQKFAAGIPVFLHMNSREFAND